MQAVDRVLVNQRAVRDHPDVCRHLVDLTEQVAGYHDCHAEPSGQLTDQLAHLLNTCRVQPVGRFVQNEQPRMRQQSGSQPEPLLHAERIVRDLFILLAGQAHDIERLPDVVLRHIAQGLQDPEVFLTGQVAVIGRGFDQRADILENVQPVFLVHPFAEYVDLTARGMSQPEDHFKRCGFACTVRAQKAVDRTLRNRHAQVLDAHGAAVAFAQPFGLYQVSHVGCSFAFLL